MAVHLVRGNSNFEIYAPIIMNSEVIVYKSDLESIKTLGIGQKREHLKEFAMESHSNIENISEISPNSLSYALETDLVDGVVLDISKAGLLKHYNFAPLSDKPYISYNLVARKDVIDSQEFKEFISHYNDVIEAFSDKDYLKDKLEIDSLYNLDIKFLNLD